MSRALSLFGVSALFAGLLLFFLIQYLMPPANSGSVVEVESPRAKEPYGLEGLAPRSSEVPQSPTGRESVSHTSGGSSEADDEQETSDKDTVAVTGEVLWPEGGPVDGGKVWFEDPATGDRSFTLTDSAGRFRRNLPRAERGWETWAEKYDKFYPETVAADSEYRSRLIVAVSSVVSLDLAVDTSVVLRMNTPPGWGEVRGQFERLDGVQLKQGDVTARLVAVNDARRSWKELVLSEAEVASDGSFRIRDVPVGDFRLELRSTQHLAFEANITVEEGGTVDLGLINPPLAPEVWGVVRDSEGDGVEGVWVGPSLEWDSVSGLYGVRGAVKTNNRGEFKLRLPSAGPAELRAFKQGCSMVRAAVNPGQSGNVIEIDCGQR